MTIFLRSKRLLSFSFVQVRTARGIDLSHSIQYLDGRHTRDLLGNCQVREYHNGDATCSKSLHNKPRSEVELVDVLFVKNQERAQPYLVISHFDLAQLTGADGLITALELAGGERVSGIDRQITEVQCVPEHD